MSDTARPKSTGDKLSAREVNEDLPIEMTAGEAISGTPKAIYIKDSDGYVYKCDASFSDERIGHFIGFNTDISGASGSPVSVQTKGIVEGFSGLDAGKFYYLSDTAGDISTAPGTYEKLVGIAISTTELLILKGVLVESTPQTIVGQKTFGTFPLLPSGSPTSNNQAAPKIYVDEIPHKFGSYGTPYSIAKEYQANTDGFVLVRCEPAANKRTGIQIAVDSGSPTTVRLKDMADKSGATLNDCGFSCPVPKNWHWQVDEYGDTGSAEIEVYWVPLS